jgi:serine/threonine protein kinase/tetratricopeptide (TPR) repeat protein
LDERRLSTPACERIGPYRVVRTLGAGGMGEVVLAHDERLDRLVAIKRLHGDAATPERRERFRREARIVARLDHPAIVQIHDVHHEAGHDYLIMEYVEGQTLRARCASKPMTVSEGLDITHQIALGMAVAHDLGVIHRDLKAENVLINQAGRVKLTDFGIAKLEGDDTVTADGAVVGTFRAMSPEQALGRPIDHRSDLFSFGILLYEALTGASPFCADTPFLTVQRLVSHEPRPIAELVPSIPDGLASLVHQLLAKQPLLRPRDFHEVADALIELAGQAGDASCRAGASRDGLLPPGDDLRSTEHSVTAPRPLPDTAAPAPPPPDPAAVPAPSRESPERPAELDAGVDHLEVSIRTRSRRGWRRVAVLGGVAVAALGLDQALHGNRASSPLARVAVLAPTVSGDAGHPFTAELAATVRNAVEASVRGRVGLALVSRGDVDGYIDGATQDGRQAPGLRATRDAVGADEILATGLACERDGCQVTIERDAAVGAGSLPESFKLALGGDGDTHSDDTIDDHLSGLYPDHPLRDASRDGAIDPADHARYVRLVQDYWSRDDAPASNAVIDALDGIRQRSPRSLDALLFEVELLRHRWLQTGDRDAVQRATALLDAAGHQLPDSYGMLSARFDLLLAVPDRLDDAGTALDRLAPLDPDSSTTHLQRARFHYERQELEAARDELDAAGRRGPVSWRVLYHRALVFQALDDRSASRVAIDQLLARSPGNYGGLALLAREELHAGRPACAAETYARLVKRQPLYEECLGLGAARVQLRSYREAADSFRCALVARPDDPEARLGLAETLLLAGAADTARAQLRDLRALLDRRRREAPSSALSRRDLAIEAQTLGYLGDAAPARARADALVADAQRSLTLRRGALRTAAVVHAYLGDHELAARYATLYLDDGNSPGDLAYPWFDDLRRDAVLGPRLAVPSAASCEASPVRGRDWLRTRSRTPGDITDVWGDQPNDIYAVAGGYSLYCNGTILHYDGTSWQRMSSGTQTCLFGIWGSGPRDIYAVGGWGTVVHYDGTGWQAMSSGTESLLSAVWGTGPRDVYAVGVKGTILHYDGLRWQSMKSGSQSFLLRVWGSGPRDIYITGGGTLHYDGTSWQAIEAGSHLYHQAIWGTSSEDVYAAGSNGLIAHYDGRHWVTMDSGTEEWIHRIWGSGPNDVYAVGAHGMLLHYDGRAWRSMRSGEIATFESIWGDVNGSTRIIGGYGGVIYQMTTPEQLIQR